MSQQGNSKACHCFVISCLSGDISITMINAVAESNLPIVGEQVSCS